MNFKILELQKTSSSEVFVPRADKIVLQALIPSLERRIVDIKEYAAKAYFIDQSSYGYERSSGNHLVERDLAAFLVSHSVEGFNYFDNGNVYRCLNAIIGVKHEGNKITLRPLRTGFSQAGYADVSEHKNFELLNLENGILSYNETLRTGFEEKSVHNKAGVIYAGSKIVRVANGTKKELCTLDLKQAMEAKK